MAVKFDRFDLCSKEISYRIMRQKLARTFHKFPHEVDEMPFLDAADSFGYDSGIAEVEKFS